MANSASRHLSSSSLLPFIRLYLFSTQLAYVALTIGSPIVGYEVAPTNKWTWNDLISAYIEHGRYTLFLGGSSNIDPSVEALELTNQTNALVSFDNLQQDQISRLTSSDKVTGLFQLFITISHFIVLFFKVTVFGNCAVTLWAAASAFKDEVVKSEMVANRDHHADKEDPFGCVQEQDNNDTKDLSKIESTNF